MYPLLRSYLALVPPRLLAFPTNTPLQQIHDSILNDILLNSHASLYSPSRDYQIAFWKWIIDALEISCNDSDLEIDDRIYEHYTSLISQSPISSNPMITARPPENSYITYTWPKDTTSHTRPGNMSNDLDDYHTATLLESRSMIRSGTTGLRTWTASFALAQYLILQPNLIKGKRILELGSGTGFLGIVLATIQQQFKESSPHIRLTDLNHEVLEQCRHNVKLLCNASSAHPDLIVCSLDWAHSIPGDPDHDVVRSTLADELDADFVLGADLVFDPSLITPLIHTFRIALTPSKNSVLQKTALLAMTVRNRNTYDTFLSTARHCGMLVENLNVHLEHPLFAAVSENASDVQILKITRALSVGIQ